MKDLLLTLALLLPYPVMADDFSNQMGRLQESNRQRSEQVQQKMRQQDQFTQLQNQQIQIKAEQERQKALIDYSISQQQRQK